MADLIKVHVTYDYSDGPGGEFLWAARINETTAKLDNIPFFTDDFTLGDLVEIDSENEIIGVIERVARTRHGTYEKAETGDDERLVQWLAVRDYLLRYDIHSESATPGFFAVAVPNDVSDEQLAVVFEACQVPLALMASEEDSAEVES